MVLAMIDQLRATGADVPAALSSVGLVEEELRRPDHRITHGEFVDLLIASERITGDTLFGLHAGERITEDRFDVGQYLASSQQVLRDSYQRVVPYMRLVHDGLTFQILERGDIGIARCTLAPGLAAPRGLIEYVLARCLVFGAHALGHFYEPTLVRFRHRAPADAREHRRVFHGPVEFQADHDEVVFPIEYLDLPLVSANEGLSKVLEMHAQDQLKRMPVRSTVAGRARAFLAQRLGEEHVRADDLAAHLRMSARTLRRRLADENTSLKLLLDDLRRERACEYVRQGEMSVAEMAYHLGFASPTAFRRAFKRWTGETPTAYRETHRVDPQNPGLPEIPAG